MTCQSIWNRLTSRQTLRWSLVKKNGEKRQISSFGQISRRPPPAKPQPIGERQRDPLAGDGGGMPDHDADDRAGVGPGDQAGQKRAGERQVGRLVIEEQPRDDAGGQREAEAGGEDQPLRPVALLGQQDAAEPWEAHQHRRQRSATTASLTISVVSRY